MFVRLFLQAALQVFQINLQRLVGFLNALELSFLLRLDGLGLGC